ncbi:long-chain-fatty-acid--CoA ligase 5 [Acyrthosiphon pisum]|uniref:Long-chain-fatty-acid--CoA ligase n=1 Tax=Acyrthosiphon pisum TaxID=7029 RepID=A0A8R2A5R6_ACYPI|nr:long-chain-fatty-acid--CoA ligase 5 [Acyrthosiphon pisum]|eukprot:XP_001949298.1 PREDICTED: long-chain-fatty-acid--CoA ligase 5 [Acyrthosiphon pisum]
MSRYCPNWMNESPLEVPINLDHQSDLLKGPEIVHVSKFYKEGIEGKFLSNIAPDARTLYETFRKGAKVSNNGKCLGWRENISKPFQWIHYNETLLRARNFGSGLLGLGFPKANQIFLGIFSQNCPEWILTEQAAYCFSMVVVPLYDTLGPEACSFIINQAEISVVVVDTDDKCNQLLDRSPKCLRRIIVIRGARPSTSQKAKNRGVELLTFEEVEKAGASKTYPEQPPKPTDLCTICYTSGTTGLPKGVMLTHGNVVAAVSAVLVQLSQYRPSVGDVMISYLPLAHMLERCCENGMYLVGGSVGFYNGNIKFLFEDMKVLKPTIMPSVPRLLNRIYETEMANIVPRFFKRVMFNMALRSKENEIKKGIIRKNSIWDRLVFGTLQKNMGGRLRLMITGSAPMAGNVLTFMRCALGCIVVEGYGQTECTAPITLSIQGDMHTEHVGPPIACNLIKLADVPEMEYYATSNQGEICVKGSNIFQGYFKDPDAVSFDDHGWHHTGDIGMWLSNGTLKIIDRKRHIFKLSQGEYIVPEKIETIYHKSQYVHQVFVHGESLKSCIIAIVVPMVDVIKTWAHENGISGTLSVLCANPEVKKLIMDDMTAWGKDGGLKSFEQVKDVYLHPDPFSVQNGLLTPTFKMKRPQVRSYFAPQIEDMYMKLK